MISIEILNNLQIRTQILQYYSRKRDKHLQLSNIQIESIFSLTNKVYHVIMPQNVHLLVKIYENTLAEFTDNQLQTEVIVKLSYKHNYPQIIYHCKQFRIEQYLFAQQSQLESPNLNHKIQKLTKLVITLSNYSIDYCEFVMKYNENHSIQSKFYLTNLLKLYKEILVQKKKQCPNLVKECQNELKSVLQNQNVIETLDGILSNVSMILSHNDCHLGNIIVSKAQLYLLDFQFTNFNYIGFDLGNLINQWATEYATTFSINPNLQISQTELQKIVIIYFQKLSKVYNIKRDVRKWIFYTQLGRVLSHLFWMIIGLKQINDKRIEFSMISYIKIRKQQFDIHFKRLLNFDSKDQP